GEQGQANMENHSRNNDQAARDRTNGGTFPNVGDGYQRYRVDGELAVVRSGLDGEDPGVCAAKPSTNRAGKADVVPRIAIVLREQLGPARNQPYAFASNHGRVEVGLKQTRSCPPDVEISVAAGVRKKEETTERNDGDHREGRGRRTAGASRAGEG